MPDVPVKDFWNSEGVQAHLTITQSVIQRMATNSASSKAWCVALVSAILVVVADKKQPDLALIALLPIALFFVLDGYYLALEKAFIAAYNDFIDKLHQRKIDASDLYAIAPKGSLIWSFLRALGSFSIWPFYCTLFALVLVTRTIVLK